MIKKEHNYKNTKNGFTLLELLAVLILLAVIAAIIIPIFSNKRNLALEIAHKENVNTLQKQGQLFLLTTDTPKTGDITNDLLESGLIKEIPKYPLGDIFYKVIANDDGTVTVLPDINGQMVTHKTKIPNGYIPIYDRTDLENINNDLNANYILMNNIDLSDGGWTSLGFYNGVFDGNNYIIYDLHGDNVGLFDFIGNTGLVKDLKLERVNIISTSEPVGGLAGQSIGEITNCYVRGTISGTYRVGGLVGATYATSRNMNNCFAEVNISGDDFLGGLVGNSNNSFSNSYFIGDITGTGEFLGGLAGIIGDDFNITNCYAEVNAEVNGEGNRFVGGLIGLAGTGCNFTDCYAEVNLEGNRFVGGLIGLTGSGCNFTNCYATGSIKGTEDCVGGFIALIGDTNTISECYVNMNSIQGDMYVGGFIGLIGESSSLVDCYAIANISAVTSHVGGLAGLMDDSSISLSYANCSITIQNTQFVGGLFGINEGSVTNCYSKGSITGNGIIVGGIAGINDCDINSILNCYSDVDIVSTVNIGGLVGINSSGTIENCFAAGNVDANDNGGKLIWVGEPVQNCYASEDMSVTVDTTNINLTGTDTATDNLQSRDFLTNNLGWNFTDIWQENSGAFPTLR